MSVEQLAEDLGRLLRLNPGGVKEDDAITFSDWIHEAEIQRGLLEMFRSGMVAARFHDGEIIWSLIEPRPARLSR